MPTKRSQQNAGASRTSAVPPDREGTLYVVAVSIGHPDDVTVRAIQVLRQVGLIASEDPRATQQLLAHHDIHATVTSYGPRNLREKAAVLLQRLQQGIDVAFVSDCGSPLIADPGHLLVTAAHTHGISVVPIPGPSVLIAALTVAGMPCDSFHFLGDLPSTAQRIDRCLVESLKRKVPTVAFCSVRTGVLALKSLQKFAPRRLVVVAYDLTKPNELILRGTAFHVRQKLHRNLGREITLILGGSDEADAGGY